MMMAEQTREILAELGFRSIDEAVGHVEALDTRKAITHWKDMSMSFISRLVSRS
jgi:glutamate synthase (NADPH/NADH) large chain